MIKELKFKSVEDRNRALEHANANIPEIEDLDEGIDIDKFIKESSDTIESISEAVIDPEAPEWAPPGEEKKEEPAAQIPEQKLEPQITTSNFDLDNLRRTNDKIRQDYEAELKKRDEALELAKAEFDKKLKELKPAVEDKPIIDPDTNRLIEEKSLELKNIVTDMDKIDEYSDEFVRLTKRHAKLQHELLTLKDKKTQALIEDSQKRLKAMQEMTEAQRQEQAAEKKRRDEEAAERARIESIKEASNKTVKRIEDFRSKIPELKEGRSVVEMEKDYFDFIDKVAAIYFDKLPTEVTSSERDEAYAKYSKKVPALIERVQANGIKPPADLDKYILLTDVNSIYSGSVFNVETGKWDPVLNDQGIQIGSSSMEDAYSTYLKRTGKADQAILQRERESIKSFQNAANRRAGAVELTQEMQLGGNERMTAEAAQKLIDETDEDMIMKIREKGPNASEMEKIIFIKFNEAWKMVYGENL